jgi:hypothetical protein
MHEELTVQKMVFTHRIVHSEQLTSSPAPMLEITAVTRVVDVYAVVTDSQGRLVSGLRREQFELREDGERQALDYFARETDAPLSLGLVVDTSASQAGLLLEERASARSFLASVLGPSDQAFVMRFDREVSVLQGFTADSSAFGRALDGLRADVGGSAAPRGGPRGTRLYDATGPTVASACGCGGVATGFAPAAGTSRRPSEGGGRREEPLTPDPGFPIVPITKIEQFDGSRCTRSGVRPAKGLRSWWCGSASSCCCEVPLPDGTHLVGRGEGCRVRLDSIRVSRCHARLVVGAEGVTIEDLGSRNGTWHAGRRLDGPAPLTAGANVRVGSETITLVAAGPDAVTASDDVTPAGT